MSDAQVRAALERMEAWLQDPAAPPDPEALAGWNRGFREALATAERGPGWEDLVGRAHALGERLAARTTELAVERDALRQELGLQAQGDRALRGYGASAR